jgi:hypothetical protein
MSYTNGVRSILRSGFQEISSRRYHRGSNQKALDVLAGLNKAQVNLSRELIDECNHYADDVLGARKFAPWLHVYAAVAGTFRFGWIPANFYRAVVIPRLKGEYAKIASLSALQTTIFGEGFFPDLLYSVNGLFLDPRNKVVDPAIIMKKHFESNDRMVFKRDHSMQGRGVKIFRSDEIDNKALHRLGNDVFQEYITQHPLLESFHPSSVATIRMTTAIDKTGAVSLRACYLRFGSGNGTHVASTTHIRVPANLATGELDADGFAIDWTRIPAHPDTGKRFAGVRIPSFDECVSTALALHAMMPAVNCIGWDMAVDKNNKVKVMEWNGDHNGINFSEATQGPCFRDLEWHKLNRG